MLKFVNICRNISIKNKEIDTLTGVHSCGIISVKVRKNEDIGQRLPVGQKL